MNTKFKSIGFYPADILLPQDADMTKWAVVACDQFTSQPEYWAAVEETVGESPSTLRLILPEAKLNQPDVEDSISKIAKGSKLAEDTAKALEVIVGNIDKIVELISNIAIASNRAGTSVDLFFNK